MIKHLATVVTASLVFALLGSTDASAQASGNSGTTCTQSGQQVTCTTSTVFNLPSGVNLQGGSGLSSITFTGSSNGPTCTGLSASPPTLTANTATQVFLTVTGCPTSGVNYAWASPVSATNSPAASHVLSLAAGAQQQYSVNVCLDSNASACTTYQTTVTAPSGNTPTLAGCAVTPATTNLSIGGTVTLTATCSTGTGQAGYGVTYQWRKNGNNISGQTGQTYSVPASDTSAAATLTYSVVIENNAPSTQTPSASVVVTGTPPIGGSNFCPGSQTYNTTLNASETYKKIYSSNLIGSSTHWVVRIPVGAGDTTLNRLVAQLNYGEAPSNQRAFRKVSLSRNLCDYTPSAGVTYVLATNSNSGSLEFRINDTSRPSYPAEITTGTWYFNVQNTSCPAGQQCQALLEWLN